MMCWVEKERTLNKKQDAAEDGIDRKDASQRNQSVFGIPSLNWHGAFGAMCCDFLLAVEGDQEG